jgi:hypothetical protein
MTVDGEGAVALSFRFSRARVLLCVLAASALAACSSSSGGAELTTAPSVTANGEHYAYAPGSVDESNWPKACSLLTTGSAAAAIGTAVTASRFHARCYYSPTNDAFPTLTVTILGIGNDQQDAFDRVRDTNSARSPKSVDKVGDEAVTYTLPGSPTVNLDVLTHEGLFELSLRSPVGLKTSPTRAQDILASVGRALAEEFAG